MAQRVALKPRDLLLSLDLDFTGPARNDADRHGQISLGRFQTAVAAPRYNASGAARGCEHSPQEPFSSENTLVGGPIALNLPLADDRELGAAIEKFSRAGAHPELLAKCTGLVRDGLGQ